MKESCSKKILFTNYVMMCLIVVLHSDNRGVSDYAFVSGGGELIYNLLNNLATMAVPIYFGLSGYLFFRNCGWNSVGRKIRSRVKTVVVPYLFWNLFFYGVYGIIEKVPAIGSRINVEMPEITLKVLLLDQYANPPLWFLPKLFLLQLFTPIGLWLFQKFKHLNWIWIVALVVADIVVDFGYSNPVHWISIFYGAGYLSYFYSKKIENLSDDVSISSWLIYGMVLALFIVQSFSLKWFFAPLFWFVLMIAIRNVPTRSFMRTSFFIFCTHYFVVLVVRKLLLMIFGTSTVAMFLCYIVTFVVTIILLTLVGMIFRKTIPKVYSVVCGGR